MAVAASSSSKTSEDNSFFYGFRSNVKHLSVQFWDLRSDVRRSAFNFSRVSEVTLGIFPWNSGTCSSFSGMVFCCRQVLLVVILALVRPSVAGCFAVGRCFHCWCGSQVGVGGRASCCRQLRLAHK